jgi:hypothetical protein
METIYLDDDEPHVEPIDTDYLTNKPSSTRPRTELHPMNYLTSEKLKDPRLVRYKPIKRRLPKKRTSAKSPPADAVYASLTDYISATQW